MISLKPINERRGDPRLDNNIPVKICRDDGDLVSETQNISRSGTYCRVTKFVPPMTKLKIHFLLPLGTESKKDDKKISVEGVIVRSEPASDGGGYNIAIFFSDISKRDSEYITDYVSTHLQKNEAV